MPLASGCPCPERSEETGERGGPASGTPSTAAWSLGRGRTQAHCALRVSELTVSVSRVPVGGLVTAAAGTRDRGGATGCLTRASTLTVLPLPAPRACVWGCLGCRGELVAPSTELCLQRGCAPRFPGPGCKTEGRRVGAEGPGRSRAGLGAPSTPSRRGPPASSGDLALHASNGLDGVRVGRFRGCFETFSRGFPGFSLICFF